MAIAPSSAGASVLVTVIAVGPSAPPMIPIDAASPPENAPERIVDTISIKSPIAIVENDCVIVGGTSLLNAYDRLEVLEFGAESLCDIAAMNGTIVPISEEEIREIEVAFNL